MSADPDGATRGGGSPAGGSWLRVRDVAELFGVSGNTIRRWTDDGILTSYRSPGGHRRYLRHEVVAALASRRAPRGGPPRGAGGAGDDEVVEALRRRVEALSESSQAALEMATMLSEDPASVPDLLARKLAGVAGASACEVALFVDGGLRVAAGVIDGKPAPQRVGARLREEPRRQLFARDGRRAARLTATEARDAPAAAILAERGCGSMIVVPMAVGGELLGTVELCLADDDAAEPELAVIQGFTQIASHAIRVASTVDRLERRDRTSRALFDVAGFASQSVDPDELLGVVALRLATTIGCTGCEIQTLESDALVCVIKAEGGVLVDDTRGSRYELADFPATREAIERRRPLVMTDADDPRWNELERAMFTGYGLACELWVPLYAGDEVVGGLDLYDTHGDDLLSYLDFIASVGQIVADSLVNARLINDLERQNILMAELVDLGTSVSDATDITASINGVAKRLLAAIGAENCEIYGVDGSRVVCLGGCDAHGVDEQQVGWTSDLVNYPLTAQAVASRELMVADRDDPRLTEEEAEQFDVWGYQREVVVPLVVEERVVGFLDIFDTERRDYVAYADFLRGFAPVLARSLQNAVLLRDLERRDRAQRDLVALGQDVSNAVDLDDLLRTVARRVFDNLQPTWCEISRLDGVEMVRLVSLSADGFDESDKEWRYPLSRYPDFARALAVNEAWVMRAPDDPAISDEERDWYARYGILSSVAVPLVVDGEPIATIEAEDTRQRDFGAYLDFLRSVAQLVSGAFEKGFLLEQLEHSNAELRQLVDAGLEFGASLDYDQVLESVAGKLCTATGGDCCDLYEIHGDEALGVVCVEDGVVWADFPGTTYPLEKMRLSRWMLTHLEPRIIAEIADDPDAGDYEREEWLGYGFHAGLLLPLVTGAQLIGIAGVYSATPGRFSDTTAARGLAQIAAQAMLNARLHAQIQRTARRMMLMSAASLEFASSLDFNDTVRKVATQLCAALDVPSCDINLVEGETTRCILSVTDGEVDLSYVGAVERFEDAPLLRQLVETRQPVALASRRDPRLTDFSVALSEDWGERSWMQVPMVTGDHVFGVATLSETRRERQFSDEDVATAQTICQAAAISLANADLYSDLQRTNREIELLNTVASRSAASLDIHEIAETASDELLQLVPARHRALLLFEGETIHTAFASDHRMETLEGRPVGRLRPGLLEELRRDRVVTAGLPAQLPAGLPEDWADGMRSLAAIGLFTDERLVGTLLLLTDQPDAYPGQARGFLERVGTQLSLAITNARLYGDIKRMHVNNLKALSSALNAKDYYTLGHAARVSAYTVLLGEKLGWPEDLVRAAEEAAYLHDIGKIGISDRVLLKPGKLNAEEWQLMRQHPVFSADIIGTLFDDDLVLGVRYHHERFDGKGYPNGLKGSDIPTVARAMCVVDSYDAMSFQRPYREALDEEECLTELRRCRGRQFDPAMVDSFLEVLADLRRQRAVAREIAAEAAARIDPAKHARLQGPEDEATPEYAEIAGILREVRDAHPPTAYLTTQGRLGRRYVLVVDPEEDPGDHSPVGSDIFPDEVLQILPKVLAGQDPRVNALYADQFGVWVTGLAPIVGADGGIVAVVAADLPPFSGAEQAGLRTMGKESLTSILQSAAVRSQRAELDAITDGLTGLYNHRYLHERLTEEVRRSAEADTPLSLLFCDIDAFKEFNEHLGHRAGDNALRAVAHAIEQSIRSVDLAARFGGEEFVVALIETDGPGAFEVAERIRARVNETWIAPSQDPLSVSIGVSTFPHDGVVKEELIDKADWAMHVAKRQGRNRVVAFGPDRDEPAQ